MVLELGTELGRRDADVVEHDVQPTKVLDGSIDRRLDLPFLRNVTAQRHGGATSGGDERCSLAHGLFVDVDADDSRPLLGEAEGARSPHATGGTGDNRALAL